MSKLSASVSTLTFEKKFTKNSRFIPIISLFALILSSTAVLGEDSKIFPGSTCQSTSTSERYAGGRIFNTSNANDLNVDCPIVRENMKDRNFDWGYVDGIKSGWVRVIDQNFSKDVRCTLFSHASNTSHNWQGWWETKSSTGTNPIPQLLSFNNRLGHGSGSGYYNLECTIPSTFNNQQSGVIAYRVNEE